MGCNLAIIYNALPNIVGYIVFCLHFGLSGHNVAMTCNSIVDYSIRIYNTYTYHACVFYNIVVYYKK